MAKPHKIKLPMPKLIPKRQKKYIEKSVEFDFKHALNGSGGD